MNINLRLSFTVGTVLTGMLLTANVMAEPYGQSQGIEHKTKNGFTQIDQEPTKRYIVMFKSAQGVLNMDEEDIFSDNTFKAESAIKLVKSHGGEYLRTLPSVESLVVNLTPSQRKTLSLNSQVDVIEEDPERELQAQQMPYGITKIQANQVLDTYTGNRKVCIIDTGYDAEHPDLMHGTNITGEIVDGTGGRATICAWDEDNYGHGAHIAGIISALDNDIGIVGVNPNGNLKIHNVKIIHNPNYWRIWGSDMIAAVAACQRAGADVVNMSIAGFKNSVAEAQAMQQAHDSGMLLLGAAGNRGASYYFYPASYDAVVSVGAVDQYDAAWRYTHNNDQIELTAPGVYVRSTLPNKSYGYWDGTSMAVAYASGVAALAWSEHPDCTSKQIRKVLQRSALDKGGAGYDYTYGHGIVQARAAVDLLNAQGCAAGD